MTPKYDLDKIRFSTDGPTFERAVGLYEGGKVTRFKAGFRGYSAVVLGTHPYEVFVSDNKYDVGTCTCYLGQEEMLCKHMVAVAIYAVKDGSALSEEEKVSAAIPTSSDQRGELAKGELADIKKRITASLRYIKPYNGPSRVWFQYQNSLQEGCARLSQIVSELPVSVQTATLLVDLLLRLDDKLCRGGVDDSDGTVGGFMEGIVSVLLEYAQREPQCIEAFRALAGKETCFGWEESLVKTLQT